MLALNRFRLGGAVTCSTAPIWMALVCERQQDRSPVFSRRGSKSAGHRAVCKANVSQHLRFAECMETIAGAYAQPGCFLCFSHGDPAPSNNHISNGQVRLLDFEYVESCHALYDLSAWNVLCSLSMSCVQEMERCFRREVTKACSSACDEPEYRQAWAMMCAFRALTIVSRIGPEVPAENRPCVDADWTARHAVLAAVGMMLSAASGIPQLTPMTEAAYELRKTLRQRWPVIVAEAETAPPVVGL
jgi:hypothetical protein